MVAGSNPVSPTEFVQVKYDFHLLPLLAAGQHLILCHRRPGIEAPNLGAKAGLTCAVCPDSPHGAGEISASCDRQVGGLWPRVSSRAETSL